MKIVMFFKSEIINSSSAAQSASTSLAITHKSRSEALAAFKSAQKDKKPSKHYLRRQVAVARPAAVFALVGLLKTSRVCIFGGIKHFMNRGDLNAAKLLQSHSYHSLS